MTQEHRLIAALNQVKHELLIPAAEYVPAIPACWEIIDAALAASTPVGGWEDISTAPKDGTLIMTWCVHTNAEYCDDAVAEGYAGPVLAKWIDHNGGGFTWHGLAGQHTHWRPLPAPPPPSVSIDNGSRPQEAVPTEQAEPAVVVLKELIPAVEAYLMTGDAMAQSLKRRTWGPVLKRARQRAADGCSSNEGAA